MLAGDELQGEEPYRHADSCGHAERPECPEEMKRTGHIAEQKTDGQQIEEDADGARDSIVRLSCQACRIGDGNFADAGSEPGGERGNEAMHLPVKRDILDDFAAVGFEGGAEVVDIDSAEEGHKPVGCT